MRQRGFSLLELLIVVAIIGVIAGVVIMSLEESRRDSRNQAVVSQMFEYQKAIELYYSDVGSYPGTNANRSAVYCFGEGATGNCFTGTAAVVSSGVNDAFSAYMTSLPRFEQSRGSFTYSSPAYSGCTNFTNPANLTATGGSSCTPSDYSIFFLLEGTNEECGRASVANPSLDGEYTLCRLMPVKQLSS